MRRIVSSVLIVFVSVTTCAAQTQKLPPPPMPRPDPAAKPAPVEKLSATSYRIGQLRVDTAKREVVATGTINEVSTLEFVANTKGGLKAYESAITIDTDAISFNAALLLIGLDQSRARVPRMHFDPVPPQGDPLDIFVDINSSEGSRRLRIEELLFDLRTKKSLEDGPWVYTGSVFVDTTHGKRFMADMDGVLIGFVHSPAPVIENPRQGAVNAYGSVVLNPALGLAAGSSVTITIKALPR